MKCPVIDYEFHRKKTVWPMLFSICKFMNCTPDEIKIISIKPYHLHSQKAEVCFLLNGKHQRLEMFFCNRKRKRGRKK